MSFAVVIMLFIIVIAFFTVVAVMYFGTREGEAMPHSASDSTAANTWIARADARQEAYDAHAKAAEAAAALPVTPVATPDPEPAATTEPAGTTTGQSIGDLSDAEREAKRQAAIERRKARAAKKAAEAEASS